MKIELNVEGMSCASCVSRIEKALKKVDGVEDAQVNFATGKAIVQMSPDLSVQKVVDAVHAAGYHAELKVNGHAHQHHADFYRFFLSALLTLPLLLQMFFPIIPPVVQLVLATIVQFWGGLNLYKGSFHALRTGSANMDLLIIMGTTAAYLFSLCTIVLHLKQPLYFDTSALIITLVLFGRWLESKAKARASDAIQKLLQLQPKSAKVKRDGEFVEIPIADMKKGDLFMVRPGENIPVDGEVVEGESAVNEAMLTGESAPVKKETGAPVFAATNNLNGGLIVKATKLGNETALAAIIRLVEQAQSTKAPIQRLADTLAGIFVPFVILISLLTFAGWLIAGGGINAALINAVAVLVIACPCAIGLATPTVIVVASGKGASLGILFREAKALERAKAIDLLLIDKTGTITEGKPAVTKVEGEGLEAAYALENLSQHPIAQAICDYAKSQKVPLKKAEEFISIPGKGVRGKVDGQFYTVGSLPFAEEEGISYSGEAACLVWNKERLLGSISIHDRLRKNSAAAIARLNAMNIHTVMLTGDKKENARAVAAEANVQEFEAEILPENKAEKVKQFKTAGKVVGMVGDGINDAPALAAADVSFAIGAGSDIAIESADITLVRNDLQSVVEAIQLSQETFKKIRQNLFFAFIYNSLGIPLAAIGLLNPVIAAAAMAMSSVSVVGNALLLKRWKPK
jgi:P-type Cu+ transporter